MKTITTVMKVLDDGTITLNVKTTIPPGEHHVVLVIDEQTISHTPQSLPPFPVIDPGPWPDSISLRREDMYDEWGR